MSFMRSTKILWADLKSEWERERVFCLWLLVAEYHWAPPTSVLSCLLLWGVREELSSQWKLPSLCQMFMIYLDWLVAVFLFWSVIIISHVDLTNQLKLTYSLTGYNSLHYLCFMPLPLCWMCFSGLYFIQIAPIVQLPLIISPNTAEPIVNPIKTLLSLTSVVTNFIISNKSCL